MTKPIREPFQLLPVFRERVWGKKDLSPFFSEQSGAIGEVWFSAENNLTSVGKPLRSLLEEHPDALGTGIDSRHPGLCPLLVKILFTTDRLSVQVHPNDEHAARHHQSLGKTEAWYVMDSQPPGEVAIGFREPISQERLETSALSGEIEQLLDWRKVAKGDVVFTPAGTVHAIGAGLTICEIQQNSDITYRLYDYGRPRELHLAQAKEVSSLVPHDYEVRKVDLAPGRTQLIESDYFRIERVALSSQLRIEGANDPYLLLISLSGTGTIAGQPFTPGQVWFVPAQAYSFVVDAPDSEWLITYKADSPYQGIELNQNIELT
jgi:mannose-6-phosphate isomerase